MTSEKDPDWDFEELEFTEDANIGAILEDLPPAWTQEEIRGVRRFVEIMLAIQHPSRLPFTLNELRRTLRNSGIPDETIDLPTTRRKVRPFTHPSKRC